MALPSQIQVRIFCCPLEKQVPFLYSYLYIQPFNGVFIRLMLDFSLRASQLCPSQLVLMKGNQQANFSHFQGY